MNRWLAGLGLLLGALPAQANDRWQFSDKVDLTGAPRNAVYHHLDGAGRKHIAVSGEWVALAWEDNRSATPQVYASVKSPDSRAFSAARQVSDGRQAYEPSIAAAGGARFLLGYEQDGQAMVRILEGETPGDALTLGGASAGHVSVAAYGERLYAGWRERVAGRWYVKVVRLRSGSDNRLQAERVRAVESEGLETPVLFPVIAANAAGLCVAWEDRRAGHTRLLSSYAPGEGLAFAPAQSLNEFFSNRNQYDQGNGVTRVSINAFAEDEILAAWMDKRRGGAGYGIYASLATDAGQLFGPNEKVHGEEGDLQPHNNPATAGNPAGEFAVAWDDFRRGDSDVWISAYNDDLEWGDDIAPGVASGAGEQSHPSIALDSLGNLHLLWIERENPNAPSRLWYSLGRPGP